MSKVALLIWHKTLPGKREEVRAVWMRHIRPAVARNRGHEAYFYCFENADPDGICAFQVYANERAAQRFLQAPGYAAYLKEVEPLLSGPPQVASLTPAWIKPRARKSAKG